MGKGSFKRYPNGSVRKADRFERASSGTARSASCTAGTDFTAFATVKRAETAFVDAPEGSNDVGFAFVARCGFRFSKTVKKYSVADGTEASAFTL